MYFKFNISRETNQRDAFVLCNPKHYSFLDSFDKRPGVSNSKASYYDILTYHGLKMTTLKFMPSLFQLIKAIVTFLNERCHFVR